MDKSRKKELTEQYNQIKKYMGVYKITNKANGKIYVGSSINLKNKWLTIQMSLDNNMHKNLKLQKDWNELGAENFSYEVLEEKEVKNDMLDKKGILAKMERGWILEQETFGEKGYNEKPDR